MKVLGLHRLNFCDLIVCVWEGVGFFFFFFLVKEVTPEQKITFEQRRFNFVSVF